MSKSKKGRIGSSFDDYLKDEGTYEETSAAATSARSPGSSKTRWQRKA
jgi:hypothetical protein